MTRNRLTLWALFLCILGAEAQDWNNVPIAPNPGANHVWQLQDNVSDDFNYSFNAATTKSNFGNNKWYNFYHNAWDGPGTTYWKYNHVAVDGSDLVIHASRWDRSNEDQPISQYPNKMNKPNDGISAGCITSNQTVLYPVFVEASISVANIALASDVWLLSADDTQEIDIIECYGGADSGNAFFAKDIHLSHHSFVRNPFQDYQPRGHNSWWTRSDITTSWGDYCWNNGNRKYVQIGVNWIGPKHFEYYIDGELVRVLYDKASATKNGNTWFYTYPSMTNGVLDFDSDGYQTENAYSTSSNYSFDTLKAASNTSSVSVIDPYNFQNGNGFTKPLDVIVNVESQNWHVDAGRTPSDALLNDPSKNTLKVDWIRAYKPVLDNNGTSSLIIEAEDFINTDGTYNDGYVPYGVNKSSVGINYVNEGDEAEYSLNVPNDLAGEYHITYQISTPLDDTKIAIYLDGVLVSDDAVPNNGSWDSYQALTAGSTIILPAGTHNVKIVASGTNAWQWNLDKIVFSLENSLSTPEITQEDVAIYPNPASQIINIKSKVLINHIEVYNVLGAKVLEKHSEFSTISVANLKPGNYFLRLATANGSITKHIVVKHN
ncbi:carbohydrate-binding protein [Pseudotamlana carrageenivorans]|uniref:Beta-agarase n=1 Tax=Pseudotamlana carrageenivorans TaxID=2069432 RepID=A0A2I7SJZ3_9FLAO|nr:carbohydrate-binding protein [Tamlana carrageenivorans]AUS06230.1 hypothetical protein C1A40_12565 [Tamlana carrageenivorans]